MNKIIFILFLSCITTNLQAQCESTSQKIWDIIQNENYESFEKLLMPIDQQRKILHWPKSEEADNVLTKLSAELKSKLTESAKKVRLEMTNQGFDIKSLVFKECEFKEKDVLTITLSDAKKEYSFTVEILKTDKIYITYPINANSPKLPKIQFTDEELANATIHINGEEFKRIKATEAQKKKGLEIVQENCLKGKKTADQKIVLVEEMKAKNGAIILSFVVINKSNSKAYTVNLEKENCKQDW